MPDGTGLDLFGERFPTRTFDVGIAEQHAVTLCAGMAAGGLKPFAAIYSTFLQRGYDQVVHDVAIQRLPVRFAIDRAGLVGADGATHAGSYDIAYLANLPGFVVMAAADEAELVHMIRTALEIEDRPSAFRYPRGEGVGVEMPETRHGPRDRPGPHDRRGQPRRDPELRRPPERGAGGRRDARAARPDPDGGRCPFRQTAGRGDDPATRPPPRGADHHRGRRGGRLRLPRRASLGGSAACSTRGSSIAPWSCPTCSSTRASPEDMYTVAKMNAGDIVEKVLTTLGVATLEKRA